MERIEDTILSDDPRARRKVMDRIRAAPDDAYRALLARLRAPSFAALPLEHKRLLCVGLGMTRRGAGPLRLQLSDASRRDDARAAAAVGLACTLHERARRDLRTGVKWAKTEVLRAHCEWGLDYVGGARAQRARLLFYLYFRDKLVPLATFTGAEPDPGAWLAGVVQTPVPEEPERPTVKVIRAILLQPQATPVRAPDQRLLRQSRSGPIRPLPGSPAFADTMMRDIEELLGGLVEEE